MTRAGHTAIARVAAARGRHVPQLPPDQHLSVLAEFWRVATASIGEDLGLALVAESPIGALGAVSYSTVSAATLGEALDRLGRDFLPTLIPGMSLRIVPVERDHIEIRGHLGLAPLPSLALEEVLIATIFRHLTVMKSAATVTAVSLRRPAPQDVGPWRAFFGILPRFSQPVSALRLATSDLLVELQTANPEVHKLLTRPTGDDDGHISGRVRDYLRPRLREPLSAARVAAALNLTPRTLQRRLLAEKTSLRDLAAAVRIDVARTALEQSDQPVGAVGTSVGFGQAASFSRAFAAATGESPLEYRRRHRTP